MSGNRPPVYRKFLKKDSLANAFFILEDLVNNLIRFTIIEIGSDLNTVRFVSPLEGDTGTPEFRLKGFHLNGTIGSRQGDSKFPDPVLSFPALEYHGDDGGDRVPVNVDDNNAVKGGHLGRAGGERYCATAGSRQSSRGGGPGAPPAASSRSMIPLDLERAVQAGDTFGHDPRQFWAGYEILHAPENFELAAIRILSEQAVYLFGTTYLGTQDTNRWLEKNSSWVNFGWKGFLGRVAGHTLEKYGQEASYWYTSFLPRVSARTIGGVDFEYMNGVAGEDDDFRDRMSLAGYAPLWAPELEGLHQDHSDEGEAHRVRTTDQWQRGLAMNRALYQTRRSTKRYPAPANATMDWTARECFVEELRWRVGSKDPERISKVD